MRSEVFVSHTELQAIFSDVFVLSQAPGYRRPQRHWRLRALPGARALSSRRQKKTTIRGVTPSSPQAGARAPCCSTDACGPAAIVEFEGEAPDLGGR